MPAIDLIRLKNQTRNLITQFNRPPDFIRLLHEILDYYTNRTIRPSQAAIRSSLPSYQTPHSILRQIETSLTPLVCSHPVEGLELVRALWNAGYFETRLLSAQLLGKIPSQSALSLLSNLPSWMNQTTDRQIQTALLTDALTDLRTHNQEAFLTLVESWLGDNHHKTQIWGLQALIPLLQSVAFENMPTVLRILKPAIERASPVTQLDLQSCLIALESISPVETVEYLQDIIQSNPSSQVLRVLRRILSNLSPDLSIEMREILRSYL